MIESNNKNEHPEIKNERKASDAEIEIYVNQILHMMINGYRRRFEIIQYINKMNELPNDKKKNSGWVDIKKTDRMIDVYIKRATEKLKEANAEKLDETLGLLKNRLEELYKACIKEGKHQTANHVLKNMMYLNGIGGFNLRTNFSPETFDLNLTEDEKKEYNERMKSFYSGFVIDEKKDI